MKTKLKQWIGAGALLGAAAMPAAWAHAAGNPAGTAGWPVAPAAGSPAGSGAITLGAASAVAVPAGSANPPAAKPRAPSVPSGHATSEGAVRAWERHQAAGQVGANGALAYAYGDSRPVINCAPLHLCVIELMKDERVSDISIGDSVRWRVASSGAGAQPVVVVKPVSAGLETNLTVMTDAGRVYYMTLRSSAHHYVPLVSFYDPQALIEHVNAQTAQERGGQEKRDATLGNIDPAKLDFGYTCHGKAAFAPEQVFSGAGHVYMKMPDAMAYGDAPAVFDTSHGSTELLNGRLAHGYDIIDGLPEKFRLVSGVGHGAQTVDCEHKSGSSRDISSVLPGARWP